MESKVVPTAYNTDEMTLEGKLATSWVPSKTLLEIKGSVKAGSPTLGGALRLWFSTDLIWKNSKEIALKPTFNFQIKDIANFGFGLTHDTKTLTALDFLL